ncbi:MAG: hypothetical protein ABIT38_22845, partial [Gemmatimonadaceae bacterium]
MAHSMLFYATQEPRAVCVSIPSGGKMRTTIARLIVPIGLLAAACSKGGAPSGAVSDDLQKDLQAASASKLELANQAGAYKPMRFVSEIEQSNGAVPVAKSRVPKPVATKSAGTQPE